MCYSHMFFKIRAVISCFATNYANKLWIFVTFIFHMAYYIFLSTICTPALSTLKCIFTKIFLFGTVIISTYIVNVLVVFDLDGWMYYCEVNTVFIKITMIFHNKKH
uniref:Uncharacterized protein n=1 Tax=Schizaphis graminum TaxID=13262 RepID=A0A2S2PUD2_SCHGA